MATCYTNNHNLQTKYICIHCRDGFFYDDGYKYDNGFQIHFECDACYKLNKCKNCKRKSETEYCNHCEDIIRIEKENARDSVRLKPEVNMKENITIKTKKVYAKVEKNVSLITKEIQPTLEKEIKNIFIPSLLPKCHYSKNYSLLQTILLSLSDFRLLKNLLNVVWSRLVITLKRKFQKTN